MHARITSQDFAELCSEIHIDPFAELNQPFKTTRLNFDDSVFPYASGVLEYGGDQDVCLVSHQVTANRTFQISSSSSETILSFCFSLQGDFPYRYAHMSDETIWKAGSANVWFSQDSAGYCLFPERTPIKIAEVLLSESFISRMQKLYPEIWEPFQNAMGSEVPFSLYPSNRPFTPDMMSVFQCIQHSEVMGNWAKVYREAKLIELMVLFLQAPAFSRPAISARDYDALHTAKDILLSHFVNPPSLVELAHMAGINEFKLKKGFKEYFGNTVYGVLLDYRMDMAKRLLLDSDKPLQEIALACGYTHLSHFCLVFRKKFGCTPSALRRGTVVC